MKLYSRLVNVFRRSRFGLGLGLFFALGYSYSFAYVISTNSSGSLLHWESPVRPTFYANWLNSSFLSSSQVFIGLTNSLQRWKNSGVAAIDFDYFQNTGVNSWGYDGHNAVFFSSQSAQKLGGSTLGVTYIFSSGGRILETDVEFNDDVFDFTATASDSTQFGVGYKVFLENVATHEFGHVFGLGHSAVLQSAMMFLEDRGQAKPSCDDIHGIASLYGTSSYTSARGSLSGTIRQAGTPVFGAHVLAISKTRGTVVAGGITQPDGTFQISGLEPGDYFVMLEPFASSAPISSLCGGSASSCHYGAVNSNTVCAGSSAFRRSFIENTGGVAQKFSVVAGATTAIGTRMVSCSNMTSAWGDQVLSIANAPVILLNSAQADASIAVDGVMPAGAGSNHYFKLQNVGGNLKVHVLAYGLYSPIDPKVTIVDASGSEVVGATLSANVFTNLSQFTNYDAKAVLNNAPVGTYYVRVTSASNLSASYEKYPAGIVGYGGSNPQIDTVGYYLLIVTANDSTTLLPNNENPTLASNARCEAVDNFSTFPDKGPGIIPLPPEPATTFHSTPARSPASEKVFGACGTMTHHSRYDGHSEHDHVVSIRHILQKDFVFSIWGIVLMLFVSHFSMRWLASRRFAR